MLNWADPLERCKSLLRQAHESAEAGNLVAALSLSKLAHIAAFEFHLQIAQAIRESLQPVAVRGHLGNTVDGGIDDADRVQS